MRKLSLYFFISMICSPCFAADSTSGPGGSFIGQFLNEGSTVTRRSKVNWTGSGVDCVDNSVLGRIDCTVSSIAPSPAVAFSVNYNGVLVTTPTSTLNFMPPLTGSLQGLTTAQIGVSAISLSTGITGIVQPANMVSTVTYNVSTQTISGRNTFTSTQSIRIVPNAGTGSTAGTSGALLVDGTAAYNGIVAQIYRNDPNTQGQASALLGLIQNATSYNTNTLWIINQATSTLGGAVEINLHANNPDIEMRELDKYSAGSGVGQWEIALNNDNLQVNFRNAGDTSFQNMISWDRDSGQKWKELDDNADYVSFKSTQTLSTSYVFVLPSDTPAVGESWRVGSTTSGNYNLEWNTVAPVRKTLAELRALAAGTDGLAYYCTDCTTDGIVISTGTGTAGQFSRISSKTTAIQ